MRPAPRMGLLFATIALPLSAVLASQILGERPAPKAPVEVRVGDAHSGVEAGIGHPAKPPSPAAVRPLVVGEHTTTTSVLLPDLPGGQTTSTISPAGGGTRPTSPGAGPTDPPEPTDPGDGKARGKGHGVHPTPSHAPTPGTNGSGE